MKVTIHETFLRADDPQEIAGGEGDLNPQTSHALGGNPTASALGTDTDGSGGNQYEPASAASGTSPLATSAANGSRSGSLGKVPQAAGAGRTGFGENPVARWPRPEPRASSEPAYACGKCKLHGSMHKP